MPASISRWVLSLLASICLGFAGGALAASNPQPKDGIWRGEFTVNGEPLPFNFELKGAKTKHGVLTLINGGRRDDFPIAWPEPGHLFVKMNTYDAALDAQLQADGRLVGVYKSLVPSQRGTDLPFTGEPGKHWRFVDPAKGVAPRADLSGKWEIRILSKEVANNQVALLEQKDGKLGGVFMTVVGDTRELEGTVQGDEFFLSGFSGPSPVLIKGKIDENGAIVGAISLGLYRTTKFEGSKRTDVELPDPYKLTYLKPGYNKLDFSFPDLGGKPVSLADDKYRGKVVIVEIIGTWCPNCTDQTRFLSPWFKANRQRGVEAIAVAFEQEDSLEYARHQLEPFREFFDIKYDLVFGGIADKKVATEKFQGLNFMAAFPTTILIDRKGEVRQIYTGYTGEITGSYYQDYVTRFNKTLDELLAEPDPFATPSKLSSLQ